MGDESALTRPMIEEANGNEDNETQRKSSHVTNVVILSLISTLFGSLSVGCLAGYSSPAEEGIMKDLDLSYAEYSVFGAIATLGGMFGSLVNGKIADLMGRRGAMWLSALLSITGWILIALGQNAWWLDIGRLFLGLQDAILGYAVPIYIAEISPKEIRGTFTSLNSLMCCIGVSFMYFVGTVVSWRVLAVIGIIPSLLQIIGLFFMPESPRWLAKVGKHREVEAVLQRLRGKSVDINEEALEIIDYTEKFQHETARFMDVFQTRYAFALTVAIGLVVLQSLGGASALLSYSSSIFEEAGVSSSVGTISVAVIQLPVMLWSVCVADKLGRRPLLLISAAGTCFCSFLLALSFLFTDLNILDKFSPVLAYIAFLGFIVATVVGVAVPWILMSEIFPINVKGSAGSLVILACKSSSIIVTYAFNFMMEWSSSGTFFIFSAICGSTIIFVAKLVPETKGRQLEEIQASMTNFLPL